MTEEAEDEQVDLRESLQKYSSFVDSTLKPELEKRVIERQEVEAEIAEYTELRDRLALLLQQAAAPKEKEEEEQEEEEEEATALVNLGHEVAYCPAKLNDPTTVYVNVGMGFHVQFSRPEAVEFVEKRLSFLREHVLPHRADQARTVADHLEASLRIMEALSNDLRTQQP